MARKTIMSQGGISIGPKPAAEEGRSGLTAVGVIWEITPSSLRQRLKAVMPDESALRGLVDVFTIQAETRDPDIWEKNRARIGAFKALFVTDICRRLVGLVEKQNGTGDCRRLLQDIGDEKVSLAEENDRVLMIAAAIALLAISQPPPAI